MTSLAGDMLGGMEQMVLKLFLEIDRNCAECVAAMFTNDGIWQRPSGPKCGTLAIVGEMKARPSTRVIQHLIMNFLVETVQDRHALVTFKSLAFAGPQALPGAASPIGLPIALDTYRAKLVANGDQWLVSELCSQRIFGTET